MATREELLAAGGGAGLSVEQLVAQGLSQTEAQTRASGFTGAFTGGQARAFRAGAGKAVDAQGNLVPINNSDIPIGAINQQNVLNPELAAGATLKPTLQQIKPNELQQAQPIPAPAVVSAPTPIGTAPTITAQTVGQVPIINGQQIAGGVQEQTIAGTLTSPVETLNPARLNVSDEALVEKRLESLFADVESGTVPSWAKAAHNQATEVLAARGLQGSSIAAGAVALALMQSALPIAAADAQTYFQADLNNFNAEQQSNLVNFQARQQNMLTDVSIANAAEQFNASSKAQTQQFVAGLITDISKFNNNLTASIDQFNVAELNRTSALNVNNQLAVEQFDRQIAVQVDSFNAQVRNKRQDFEANMRFAIDQSNVSWRRNVSTGNTVAENAANQVNVQNRFNLSAVAQNNLWQQTRDEAAWLFDATQNALDKDFNTTQAANNRDFSSRNDNANVAIGAAKAGYTILTNMDKVKEGFDIVTGFFK